MGRAGQNPGAPIRTLAQRPPLGKRWSVEPRGKVDRAVRPCWQGGGVQLLRAAIRRIPSVRSLRLDREKCNSMFRVDVPLEREVSSTDDRIEDRTTRTLDQAGRD